MNIHFGNQSQFELFPKTTGDTIENVAPRFIFSRIVLTFENVVVVFVFVVVGLIVAFSMGVERGRRHAAAVRPMASVAVPASFPANPLPHPQINVAPAATTNVVRGTPVPSGPQAVTAVQITPAPAPVLPPLAPNRPSEKVVDKGYTIQVASYKSESLAQKEANGLKAQGMSSLVLNKGSYWIVCVGQYAKQDEAKKTLNKLKKRYKDSIIRSF